MEVHGRRCGKAVALLADRLSHRTWRPVCDHRLVSEAELDQLWPVLEADDERSRSDCSARLRAGRAGDEGISSRRWTLAGSDRGSDAEISDGSSAAGHFRSW